MKHIIAKTISSRSKIFKLEPENISFTAKIPLPVKLRNDLSIKKKKQAVTIKAIQFPVVSNNATTGWKLQGSSVQNLYIKEWNISCKNWIYVMLSRVRNRKGLFLESRISENPNDFSLNQNLVKMMNDLELVACSCINENDFINNKTNII